MSDDTFDNRESPTFKKKRPESISARTVVDLGALSHPGKVRTENQDSFLVTRIIRSMRTVVTNIPEGEIANRHSEIAYGMLVADGVGGHPGGQVASRAAISGMVDLAIDTPDWYAKLDNRGANTVMWRMKDRLDRLRDALDECSSIDPALTGLGTTMTLAVSLGADLVLAHVGDSRAYLFTHGQLVLLTKDQTMAQRLADLGVINQEEVTKHASRHVLTGAITADGEKPEVELHHLRLLNGDQLLLCSDGLSDMVSDTDIAAVLEKEKPATEACQALVDLALEAGGRDNVTVTVARYQIPADADSSVPASEAEHLSHDNEIH